MKRITILLFSILFTCTLIAQTEYDNETPPDTSEEEFVGFNKKNKTKKDLSRIKIGGTAGFGVANGQISFNLSPTVGYQIVKDRLEIGTGIIYGYFRFKSGNPTYRYTENTIGSNNYLRIYIFKGFFAQGRGEYKKIYASDSNNQKATLNLGNVFGGAGYSFPIGDKASMNIGLEINIIPYNQNISAVERVISPFFNFQYSL